MNQLKEGANSVASPEAANTANAAPDAGASASPPNWDKKGRAALCGCC